MKLDVLLLVLLALLFFGFGICFGQVSVVHFNSEWNANNDFDITALKDCDIDSVVICHNPDLKEKYTILKDEYRVAESKHTKLQNERNKVKVITE